MNTHSRVLKWSVIIGIIIVLNLFFNYVISLVYKQPQFNNFCPMEQIVTIPDNQQACIAKGGQWTENPYYGKEGPAVSPVVPSQRGYCDLQFTCRQNFDTAQKAYDRNVFIILVVLGALSVLVGNIFIKNTVISQGLALGGVLSFIIASMRYWSAANDLIRVIILAIALGILFWVAYRKFRNA